MGRVQVGFENRYILGYYATCAFNNQALIIDFSKVGMNDRPHSCQRNGNQNNQIGQQLLYPAWAGFACYSCLPDALPLFFADFPCHNR